jgi:succinylglutamate desuccinylase
MYPGSIIKKTGQKSGKTLAVFAGIHGNEKVGVLTLKKLIDEIEIISGTVYFVYANPPAIKKGVRQVNANLNRLFRRNISGKSYEYERARELMKILDTCDALLDLHSYNSKTGNQFAISEKRGFKILKKMDFPIIVSGFSTLGSGTDGYMEKRGKIGICVECGTSNRYRKFMPLAEKTVYQFLQYFGSIDRKVAHSSSSQTFIRVKRMILKKSNKFRFVKNFKDFERLKQGSPFAYDGETAYKAAKNECILFPRPKGKIGSEACIIAEMK